MPPGSLVRGLPDPRLYGLPRGMEVQVQESYDAVYIGPYDRKKKCIRRLVSVSRTRSMDYDRATNRLSRRWKPVVVNWTACGNVDAKTLRHMVNALKLAELMVGYVRRGAVHAAYAHKIPPEETRDEGSHG